MNNNEIELELIAHFGLEKTIQFCEMNAFMYNIMYEDIMNSKHPTLNLEYAYDYERDWWLDKHNELIKKSVLSL